jgi:hypothetical protein
MPLRRAYLTRVLLIKKLIREPRGICMMSTSDLVQHYSKIVSESPDLMAKRSKELMIAVFLASAEVKFYIITLEALLTMTWCTTLGSSQMRVSLVYCFIWLKLGLMGLPVEKFGSPLCSTSVHIFSRSNPSCSGHI